MTNDFDCFPASDDLSQVLTAAPRQGLPQDEQLARIRRNTPEYKIVACSRCGGTGQYGSFGTCFKCQGSGRGKARVYKTSPEARAQAAQKRQDKALRDHNANLEAFQQAFPQHWAWILKVSAQPMTERNHEFIARVQDFPAKIGRWGDLHPANMALIERGIARDQERAQAASQPRQEASAVQAVQYPKIRAFLQVGKDAGLKAPGIGGPVDGGTLALEMAKDHSRNPGAIYVKWNGEYAGKIVGTAFQPVGAFRGHAQLLAGLAQVEADPRAWVVKVGKETICCAICSTPLENELSRERGIGPICWDKWGF